MLIVIEGIDGSGKTLQSKMLFDYFIRRDTPAKYIEFPDYGSRFGLMIGSILRGDFGNLRDIDPKLLGIFYACDRLVARYKIFDWLDKGFQIVANRYAESNPAFQGARFEDPEQRRALQDWLRSIDYDLFHVPVPDKVIVIDILPELSARLILKKQSRDYLKGMKKDIHEADLQFQNAVRSSYLECASHYGWSVVSAFKGKDILSPEVIHRRILDIIDK